MHFKTFVLLDHLFHGISVCLKKHTQNAHEDTPWKINMEPKHHEGLVQMIFLSKAFCDDFRY